VDSAVINGSQDIAPGRQFKASAHKGLDPVVASGRLVVGYEADIQGFDPAKAQTAMEQALTKLNDKVDGVLVANDGMAGVVITALTARRWFAACPRDISPKVRVYRSEWRRWFASPLLVHRAYRHRSAHLCNWGNAEAARRAGIPVGAVRIGVFALIGMLAGLGGVLSASRQFAVSIGTGGGTLLLDAIAAAVIGGTSLFGGRGRIYHAILGALVIGSVANGLDLLGAPSSTKNIATGIILVVAVSIDALSRTPR
jgi:hypothetical protein